MKICISSLSPVQGGGGWSCGVGGGGCGVWGGGGCKLVYCGHLLVGGLHNLRPAFAERPTVEVAGLAEIVCLGTAVAGIV